MRFPSLCFFVFFVANTPENRGQQRRRLGKMMDGKMIIPVSVAISKALAFYCKAVQRYRLMQLRNFIALFGLVALVSPVVSAGEVLRHPDGEDLGATVRNEAMPELDESRIGKILTRYYGEGLGGAERWEQVESLRVMGTLTLKDGEFELHAYQKKPNLIKITISADGLKSLVLCYDGVDAWQQPPAAEAPVLMSDAEARRFIHSAHFGNHLLYPFKQGKVVELIDTVPVGDSICHHIRVRLDSEYQVDYYIDIRTYLEVKVVNTDLRSGFENAVIYDDYIREFGMPIAKKVQSFEAGEWISSLELSEVKVNSGIMPWMFRMPK